MAKDFRGQVALITGGASGMGRGMAKAFAQAGMKVAIADIRAEATTTTAAELATAGLRVIPVTLDVTDRENWIRAVAEVEDRLGPVDVLVNNAGVGLTGMMRDMTYKDWDFSMGVNFGGVLNGLMTVLPGMLDRGAGGHLIVTSSTAGLAAVNGAAAYVAAKFAVTGLMETLAGELEGTGVDVSIFCPGPVQTDIGSNIDRVRPPHLRNEKALADPISPGETTATSLFMTPDEVGDRVLRGMQRRDLYILSHPEFAEGIRARCEALSRAIPVEPVNEERAALLRQYGTLLLNPVYYRQAPVINDDTAD